MGESVPLVDIGKISLLHKDDEIDREMLRRVGMEITKAFSVYGFCYFINHGINQDVIEKCMEAGQDYFNQPNEEKEKAMIGSVAELPYMGWEKLGTSAVNRSRPGDYREGFNFHPALENMDVLPSQFLATHQALYAKSFTLAFRVCDAISEALGIDRTVFRNSMSDQFNPTCLRSNYYPPVDSNTILQKDQIRCGEHSDYGTVTFLFQDDRGGLEILSPKGEYVPVPSIHGTIVANVGDMLQRWTADTLVATKHRVVIPGDDVQRTKTRQSLAFFVQPDNDCLITCLNGSDKYEPITSGQHLANMLA